MKAIHLLLVLAVTTSYGVEDPLYMIRNAVHQTAFQEDAVAKVSLALQLPDVRRAAESKEAHVLWLAVDNLFTYDWDQLREDADQAVQARALDRQQADILKLLLETRAKEQLNFADQTYSAPLYRAAKRGALQCSKVLLGAGADPNLVESDGSTPLLAASETVWRHQEIIDLLLAKGAKPNVKNKSGHTALMVAVENAAYGACPLIGEDAEEGWHHARIASELAIRLLLKAKADPTPALPVAARNGWVDGVRVLLAAGAKTDGALEALLQARINGKIKGPEFEAVKALLTR